MAAAGSSPGGLVYFVRHSERQDDGGAPEGSSSYLEEVAGNNVDIAITLRGVVLAEAAAAAIHKDCSSRGGTVARVSSSPYLRCIQTAVVIASRLGVDRVEVDARLREFHTPRDSTTPDVEDLRAPKDGGDCLWRTNLPSCVDWALFDEQTAATPGQFSTRSSMRELLARLSEACAEGVGEPGSAHVMVTHGYSIQLGSAVAGDGSEAWQAEYTCLSCMERRPDGDGWHLRMNSDAGHIGDVPAAARGDPAAYGLPPTLRHWPAEAGPRGKL